MNRRKAAARTKHEGEAKRKIAANLKTARDARARAPRAPAPAAPGRVPPFIASKIVLRDPRDLVPLTRNPRVHSDAQIEEIAVSIETFGFLVPLLVDKRDNVLAGNGRWNAAIRRGWPKVPTIPAWHLTPAQRRAYIIADNAIATHATWDDTILAEYFTALEAAGVDPTITAFSLDEIQEVLAAARPRVAGAGEPEVPAAPSKPVSKPGDLWQLGSHRLVCGDATVPDDVMRAVGDATIDCVWTEPPWATGKGDDDLPERQAASTTAAALGALYAVMHEGAAIYLAHADAGGHVFRRLLLEAGFVLEACLVWRRPTVALTRSDYHAQHEPILYGWKPGAPRRWFGGRDQTSILEFDAAPFAQVADDEWQIDVGELTLVVRGKGVTVAAAPGSVMLEEKEPTSRAHPSAKPVRLVDRMLGNSTRPGQHVLDVFAGAGATLAACEGRGLVAHLVELEPRLVDVIVQRWQNLTGRKATLASSGRAFEKVAAGRRKGE